MEKTISQISNADIKKSAFVNTQFIHFAEGGAMGEPGAVNIVTSGGSFFHMMRRS